MSLQPVVRDGFSTPFFKAAAEGRLMLRYSPTSGEWSDPVARVCSVTQSDDLEWREASRLGHLVSWTIKPGRARDGVTPPDTVIGLVETEEGPWLSLWIPDADQSALAVGAGIEVEFMTPEGSEALPIARLRSTGN